MKQGLTAAAVCLWLLATGCTTGAESPSTADSPTSAAPASAAPTSAAPTPFDCEASFDPADTEKFEEWKRNCEQAVDGGAVSTDPVPFDEKYVFEDGLITEVTKIAHPDANTIVLTVKVTHAANRTPPEITVEPSANLSYAKDKEKLQDDGFQPVFPSGQQAGDFSDSGMQGTTLRPGTSATAELTFEVPARYQGDVALNFAVSPDYQWSTFVGSVK